MEVNCTLFVQMGNFAIAYCLLRYLFFRPALAVLQVQKHQRVTAKNELQKHEDELIAQRQKVEFAWQQCRTNFKNTMPSQIAAYSVPLCSGGPSFEPLVISEKKCVQTQQELEYAIIQEVSHVRE